MTMISPKVYEKQIQDLGIEGMEIFPKNSEEAVILFDELENIEEYLKRIRYNIRMDIRAIRKDYMNKIREIEDYSKRLYGKKFLKNKIKEKRQLIDERDLIIAPYESIEYMIDGYLKQIKSAKFYVIDYSKRASID